MTRAREVLKRLLRRAYALRGLINSENAFVASAAKRYFSDGAIVLDVGCGFGRLFAAITSAGAHHIGVDGNGAIVAANRATGRECYLPAEVPHEMGHADAVVIAHLIEHFRHDELVALLNEYSSRLRPGGVLVILTPLLHAGFYDDFDHVKPYAPASMRQLLCKSTTQSQEFAFVDTYKELEIWIKRDSWWHSNHRRASDHIFALLCLAGYLLTGSLLGKRTGYGMILEKLK